MRKFPMENLLKDVRFGLRMLRKNPGFTAVAVVTLALGIGANTAIFSAVYGILFRPLPFGEADRLVTVWVHALERPASQFPMSLPDIRDWQTQNESFEGVAAYAYNRYKVAGLDSNEMVRAAIVLPDFFPLLAVNPMIGRTLGPADEQLDTAVLSYSLWQRLFHGDVNAIGQSLRLGEEEYTVAGVMPASFRFPTPEIELWLSMSHMYRTSGNPSIGNWITNRSLRGYRAFARLKEGVSLEQAQ